jgi:nitroreductase
MKDLKLIPEISARYSPLAFSAEPVDEQELLLLFEAASRAPSGYNNQPWHFLYATREQEELYQIFFECLAEANRLWAATAPVLAVNMARMHYTRKDKPNRYAWYETGLAMGNLLAQAMALNIYVHQMGGFDSEMAIRRLNIPAGYQPVAIMAIGYKGDPAILPQGLQERSLDTTTRKSPEEFVRQGKFPGEWK